jgi:cytochrome c oxidase cbb3-type subunit 3
MTRHLVVAAILATATATVASADGKAVFASKCVACHSADGKGQGTMGKKLGVKDLTATKLTAAEVEAIVTAGKGKMTPFGGKLSPAEIKEVAAFVKGGLK